MQFTDLAGRPAEGEVWSAGPLFGSAWVLVGDRAVVVHIAKRVQLEYEIPARPAPPLAREAVEKALEIRRRAVTWRRLPVSQRPSQAEIDAAQYVTDYEKARLAAEKLYREHHTASTPVATKRLLELSGIELPKRTRGKGSE